MFATRSRRLAVLVTGAVLAVLPGLASPAWAGPARPAAGDPTTYAARVVTLTNSARATAGCPALTVDARLTGVAQAHSADMARYDYFSHTSRDGRTPFDRIRAAGYRYSMAAENIAAGQRTPEDVVRAWMNSPGHRANILNCGLRQIGVGYAVNTASIYQVYWTQNFGTPLG